MARVIYRFLLGSKFMFLVGLVLLGILATYIASHWLIWFSVVKFFGISAWHGKFVLAITLFVLGVSFFVASVITHLFNDTFTRGIYFVTAVWTGFVVNLVIAFAGAWLVVALLPGQQGIAVPIFFGSIAVAGAMAYSAWGIWNSHHPIVKHISVPIANLPHQWKGKKIVQLSDVHLGYVYREKFIASVLQKVNVLKPDVIVITGDLFDGSDGGLDWVGRSLAPLSAPQGVYYVTGNHEIYLGVDEILGIIGKTNIKHLHDTFVNVDGLQIIGVDYPARGESKNVANVINGMHIDKNLPSVLLYHAPVRIDQIKKTGVSLQLSGHTHVGQQFPLRLITRIIYRGYDYGLHRDGNYTLYTTNGIGTWGPPMRTGNKPEIVCVTLA